MHKEIGKIENVFFGLGGYQGVVVGVWFTLSGKGWGCGTGFEGGWGHTSKEELEKPGSNYQWTHESRINQIGEACWKTVELMKKAKVDRLEKLQGKPIEAIFDSPNGKLISFRILEEVL